MKETKWKNEELGVALGEVLGLLSGVEEIEVEVRMLAMDYWVSGEANRKRGWFGRSVVGDGGRRWRGVERRLVACETAEEGGKQVMFFRKEEVWGGAAPGTTILTSASSDVIFWLASE